MYALACRERQCSKHLLFAAAPVSALIVPIGAEQLNTHVLRRICRHSPKSNRHMTSFGPPCVHCPAETPEFLRRLQETVGAGLVILNKQHFAESPGRIRLWIW